jgi:hypothetical protein
VVNCALERASSDRRSYVLAERDAAELAAAEGRLPIQTIGEASGYAGLILSGRLGALPAAHAVAAHALAERQMALLRATPHWIDRVAAYALEEPLAPTADESAAISQRRETITRLRAARRAARTRSAKPRMVRVEMRWHGVQMVCTASRSEARGRRVSWIVIDPRLQQWTHRSRRVAVSLALRARVRRYGAYCLRRWDALSEPWALYRDHANTSVRRWDHLPLRDEIAAAIRADRIAQPSRTAPDHLGHRAWYWDPKAGCLVSPHQGTPWHSPELREEHWTEADVVRGTAGIHARRLPRDWRRAGWTAGARQEGPAPEDGKILVHGVVERAGRYVLGTTGWRAEWVLIRELSAPDIQTYLALRRVYPEVRVHLASSQTPAPAGEETIHEDR